MNIGIKGISYSATERKYLVRIKKDSKRVYVGRYSSLEEAKEALASYGSTATPILESLRATFAPKKTKTSSRNTKTKVKSSSTIKTTQQLPKAVSTNPAKPPKVQRIKKGDTAEIPQPTQEAAEATIQIDYHRVGEISLHRILTYLIKEADKRGTSIFDVVVQEVARLSK